MERARLRGGTIGDADDRAQPCAACVLDCASANLYSCLATGSYSTRGMVGRRNRLSDLGLFPNWNQEILKRVGEVQPAEANFQSQIQTTNGYDALVSPDCFRLFAQPARLRLGFAGHMFHLLLQRARQLPHQVAVQVQQPPVLQVAQRSAAGSARQEYSEIDQRLVHGYGCTAPTSAAQAFRSIFGSASVRFGSLPNLDDRGISHKQKNGINHRGHEGHGGKQNRRRNSKKIPCLTSVFSVSSVVNSPACAMFFSFAP